jgi:hypothetical protein
VGASISHNPKGLHGLYRDKFTFILSRVKRSPTVNWRSHSEAFIEMGQLLPTAAIVQATLICLTSNIVQGGGKYVLP